MRFTTLLSFSGGVDSAGALHRWLISSSRDELILLHHLRREQAEGRGPLEIRAVRRILDWFTKAGLTRWRYLESGIELLWPGYSNQEVRDPPIIGFFEGVILAHRKYAKINQVLSTGCDDSPGLLDWPEITRIAGEKRRKICSIMAGRKIEYTAYNQGMSKGQLMAGMPEDLLSLCWSCRTPAKGGIPCGKCHACAHLARAAKELVEGR